MNIENVPFRVIISKILPFYTFVYEKCFNIPLKDHNILKFYGYFKLDCTRKIFFLWKSCVFENIPPSVIKLDIPKKIKFLYIFYCPFFVGDKIPNITNLHVNFCSKFVGDKIPPTVTNLKVRGGVVYYKKKKISLYLLKKVV